MGKRRSKSCGETSKQRRISETEKTASDHAVLNSNQLPSQLTGHHQGELTSKKNFLRADTDSAILRGGDKRKSSQGNFEPSKPLKAEDVKEGVASSSNRTSDLPRNDQGGTILKESLTKETTDSACSLKEEENVASAFNMASDELPRDQGDLVSEGSPIQATSNPANEIRDESPDELTTTQDTASDSSVENELYRAADERISELNKMGVAQGRTDINEPKRHHIPRIINMEEFEDWIKHAEEYAIDRRLKRGRSLDQVVGKEIDLNDIFDDVSTRDGSMKKCRHAIVLAPAGMGKTTLLKWIAQYGIQGTLKKLKGKLIVMPDFRTLPTDKKLHPSEALLGTMFKHQDAKRMKQRYQWMLEHPDNVVFLIDSLDTLAFDFDTERPRIGHNTEALPEDILHNLLSGDLFPNSDIISTSREFKVKNMHPNVRPDRCLIIDGLKEESVQDLIEEFLGEEKGKEVKHHIKMECPDVGPLLVVPVFLVFGMIGFVAGGFIPNTMSGILIKYYLSLIFSNHAQVKNIPEALVKLMPMAFDGILKGQVLFSLEHFDRFGINPEEVTDLGILIPFSTGNYLFSKLMQVDGFYLYFHHQTLQECLAALHILSIDLKKFKNVIRINLFKPNFCIVRRILCGILLNCQVLEASKKLVQIQDIDYKKSFLLESLRTKFQQLHGFYNPTKRQKLLEFYIDLNECKGGVTDFIQSLVKKIHLRGVSLTPTAIHAVATVMKQCIHLPSVDLSYCNLTEEKMEIISRTLVQSHLKLGRINVSGNSEIRFGLYHLGRLAQHHQIQEVDIHACNLGSRHLEKFARGLGKAKLSRLNVSDNAQLGPQGMLMLGKMVGMHGIIDLHASRCNPNSEHVQSLSRGLGTAKLMVLSLEDNWSKPAPEYVYSLLDLLPHIEEKLDLQGWEIEEEGQKQLANKLNAIGSPCLMIVLTRKLVWNSPTEIIVLKAQCQYKTSESESKTGDDFQDFNESAQTDHGAEVVDVLMQTGLKDHTRLPTFLPTARPRKIRVTDSEAQTDVTAVRTVGEDLNVQEISTQTHNIQHIEKLTQTDSGAGFVSIATQTCCENQTEHHVNEAQAEGTVLQIRENVTIAEMTSSGRGAAASSSFKFYEKISEYRQQTSFMIAKPELPDKYFPVSEKCRCNGSEVKIPIWASTEDFDIHLRILGTSDGIEEGWTEIKTMPLKGCRDSVSAECDKFDWCIAVIVDSIQALFSFSTFYGKGEIKYDSFGHFWAKFSVDGEIDREYDDIQGKKLITLFDGLEVKTGDKFECHLKCTDPPNYTFDAGAIEFNIDRHFFKRGRKFDGILKPLPQPQEKILITYIIKRNGDLIKKREFRIKWPGEVEKPGSNTIHHHQHHSTIHKQIIVTQDRHHGIDPNLMDHEKVDLRGPSTIINYGDVHQDQSYCRDALIGNIADRGGRNEVSRHGTEEHYQSTSGASSSTGR